MVKTTDIIVVVLVVIGCSIAPIAILLTPSSTRIDIEMKFTATGEVDEVSWGCPEEGFWGEENGAIDWNQMPYSRIWNGYDVDDEMKYTFEYWFRERFFNGTEWEYKNHGPFFVDFPQLEYYREIVLDNHTVYIKMFIINDGG